MRSRVASWSGLLTVATSLCCCRVTIAARGASVTGRASGRTGAAGARSRVRRAPGPPVVRRWARRSRHRSSWPLALAGVRHRPARAPAASPGAATAPPARRTPTLVAGVAAAPGPGRGAPGRRRDAPTPDPGCAARRPARRRTRAHREVLAGAAPDAGPAHAATPGAPRDAGRRRCAERRTRASTARCAGCARRAPSAGERRAGAACSPASRLGVAARGRRSRRRSPRDPADRDEPCRPTLAAEHAALYVYGVLGARTSQSATRPCSTTRSPRLRPRTAPGATGCGPGGGRGARPGRGCGGLRARRPPRSRAEVQAARWPWSRAAPRCCWPSWPGRRAACAGWALDESVWSATWQLELGGSARRGPVPPSWADRGPLGPRVNGKRPAASTIGKVPRSFPTAEDADRVWGWSASPERHLLWGWRRRMHNHAFDRRLANQIVVARSCNCRKMQERLPVRRRPGRAPPPGSRPVT